MKRALLIFTLILNSYFSYGQGFPLKFNFDTIEDINIDSSLIGNIWQIGSPNKALFNSSLNGHQAIITDTVNYYPNNNKSEFIIKTPTYMGSYGGVELHFYHKFDTDTLIDGGTIEVSYDGINWENILTSQALFSKQNSFTINDTIISLNQPGFSGRQKEWGEVYFFWNYPPTDTINVKFKFSSDSINNNKEGWIIDSLYFQYNLGVGINSHKIKDQLNVIPSPTTDNAIIYFNNETNEKHELTIFNSLGQPVLLIENIFSNRVHIDNISTPSGIYFIMLKSEGTVVGNGKLIIER